MKQYSGKFVLRLSPSLHKKLALYAEKNFLSINNSCLRLLQYSLENETKISWWKKELEVVANLVKEKFGDSLCGILVFGSQIQGTATSSSDIDLLIVLEKTIPLKRSLYTWWDKNILCSTEVTPQFVHRPDDIKQIGGIWFEVAMASEIIYERGRSISILLEKINSLITNDEIRRYWSNGQPYWIKRRDEDEK